MTLTGSGWWELRIEYECCDSLVMSAVYVGRANGAKKAPDLPICKTASASEGRDGT